MRNKDKGSRDPMDQPRTGSDKNAALLFLWRTKKNKGSLMSITFEEQCCCDESAEQKHPLCRLVETGSGSVQSLLLSDTHLAELDGDTLRLFGLGALEALERGWGVQTAAAVTVITFRYISFDAIVPTLPRIRVKFPNLSVL